MITNTSPMRSPATEPTLQDLYHALDWSKANQALAAFDQQYQNMESAEIDEFRVHYRYVLLEEALFSDNPDIKKSARYFLHCADVWEQIVAYIELINSN